MSKVPRNEECLSKSSGAPGRSSDCRQREELMFWENQKRYGEYADLKMARDLPEDTPLFILKLLSDFETKAAEFCFGEARGRVLDAGCGNGNLLLRARELAHPESWPIEFTGMDFSRNMIQRAALRANDGASGGTGSGGLRKRGGETDLDFLQGSVTSLPFRDASFDWVASSGVLTCLPAPDDATKALLEFNRVLRPGGTLVVDFFNRLSHYTLIRRYLFREPIASPEYVSFAEFKMELENAGFRILKTHGFDFKLFQGYLFMSRLQPLVDPGFVQERISTFIENKVGCTHSRIARLGYRIYLKCQKE